MGVGAKALRRRIFALDGIGLITSQRDGGVQLISSPHANSRQSRKLTDAFDGPRISTSSTCSSGALAAAEAGGASALELTGGPRAEASWWSDFNSEESDAASRFLSPPPGFRIFHVPFKRTAVPNCMLHASVSRAPGGGVGEDGAGMGRPTPLPNPSSQLPAGVWWLSHRRHQRTEQRSSCECS